MRHRTKGRKLGRNPNHQRALLKNLIVSILMTERDTSKEDPKKVGVKPPQNPGRIITTIEKAKEVRPLLEKCITIAKKAMKHVDNAKEFDTSAVRNTEAWKNWRESEAWQKWNQAIAPAVALRRRAIQLIGNKNAVKILFDVIAPRFVDREGGYTRILRLAIPRLGDSGTRAILEFVGKNDRKRVRSIKPVVDEE